MIDAVNKAIYTKLSGYSALTSQLGSVTAVYFAQAPLGAALPYIVYSIASGGEDNDTPLDAGDISYTVKGVAKTALSAGAIADSIRDALHEQSLTIDSPWTVYRCQHEAVIMYPENVERDQYWHAGGNYRIKFSV